MKKNIIFLSILIFNIIFAKTQYMNTYMGNNKIGYYVSEVDTVDNIIRIQERAVMKLNVYGKSMNISTENLSIYSKDNKLIKYFSNVISEDMTFYSNGYVKGNNLIVKTMFSNNIYTDTLNIRNKSIVFNLESIKDKKNMKNIFIFDIMGRNLEKINVKKSKRNDTLIVNVVSKTVNSNLYYKKNALVKIESIEGIVMLQTDTIDNNYSSFDLINYFLIEADGDFSNIKKDSIATYKLLSMGNNNLNNFRQKQNKNILIVYKKPLFVPDSLSEIDYMYIKPNKEIKNMAKKMQNKYSDKETLLKEIMKWTHKRIKNKIVSALENVDEILKNGYGDCSEHAQIFASLADECGFNVDIVSGIVYSKGAFYYHVWNRVLYNNKIYIIDATFNQFDADVSHIQLSEGFPPAQILIGKIEKNIKIIKLK